jgi:hypothetical protein
MSVYMILKEAERLFSNHDRDYGGERDPKRALKGAKTLNKAIAALIDGFHEANYVSKEDGWELAMRANLPALRILREARNRAVGGAAA